MKSLGLIFTVLIGFYVGYCTVLAYGQPTREELESQISGLETEIYRMQRAKQLPYIIDDCWATLNRWVQTGKKDDGRHAWMVDRKKLQKQCFNLQDELDWLRRNGY